MALWTTFTEVNRHPSPSGRRLSHALACLALAALTLLGPASVAQQPLPEPLCAVAPWNVGVADCNDSLWAAPTQDYAMGLAVHPDGSLVYAAANSPWNSTFRYHVEAHHADTGALAWTAEYGASTAGRDSVGDLAVSPTGDRVFVTGASSDASTDAATVAYDARTGQRLWVARYDGGDYDVGTHLAVSPDGARVHVAAESREGPPIFATLAYDAATGAQLWIQRSPAVGVPSDIGLSPDGSRVYVLGTLGIWDRYSATFAYDAATGAPMWSATSDDGGDLAVSPDGARVYVTGSSDRNYTTVAYDAATGAEAWVRRLDATGPGQDRAVVWQIEVSRDSRRVYVSGISGPFGSPYGLTDLDAVILGYDDAGNLLWQARDDGPVGPPAGLATSPDDALVYVASTKAHPIAAGTVPIGPTTVDMVLTAFSATTGQPVREWVHARPLALTDWADQFALSPDGTRAYAMGDGAVEVDDGLLVAFDLGT